MNTRSRLCLLMMCALTAVSQAEYTDSISYDGENIEVVSSMGSYQSLVNRDYTDGQPAYDYSPHLIFTDSGYIAFVGGRWKDSGFGASGIDGDHCMKWTSTTGNPDTWSMPRNRPEFYRAKDVGYPGLWWSNNTMDPEALKVPGGPWIMIVQVQINPGDPIDLPGETAVVQSDRLMLLTSDDCENWTRKTDRSVMINIDTPTSMNIHHPELIYVPWDADGKTYWLYFMANNSSRRIRSDDYTTFDFDNIESMSGYSQIGNQIGYMEEAPGGPMFVRISHVNNTSLSKRIPALQLSRDGLSWTSTSDLMLEGVSDGGIDNPNCYFAGISTYYGRGGLEYLGNNRFRAKYAAATSASPLAPAIFKSEIAVGEVIIDFGSGLESGAVYAVLADHSFKALTVSDGRAFDGANVHQWDYLGQNHQHWLAIDVAGTDRYKLFALHSGKALDMAGWSTANGGNAQQWSYVFGDNQRWEITESTHGMKVLNVNSGKALNVSGFSQLNGGNVQQWDYLGSSNDEWCFYKVSSDLSASFQAEDYGNAVGCSPATSASGYTGRGFVDMGGNGTWFEMQEVHNDVGVGTLTIRYALANGSRTCTLNVNGVNVGTINFEATGSWSTWGTKTINIELENADNIIRLTAGSAGGPNIDRFNL